MLCCLVIAMGEPYGVLVLRGSPMAADFSTGAALFLFLVPALVINPVMRLLCGTSLHSGELATILIMMIVACAIPSWGFAMNLIPLMGGFFYYATPENEWDQLIHPQLPEWLTPGDPDVVRGLFEGGARGTGIPWGAWSNPLLAWSLFIVTLYFVTLCLLVILRKQWFEREKLLFPLATLPLEMSRLEDGRVVASFWRNRLMWLGFLLPATVNSINGLNAYYPAVPRIDVGSSILIMRHSMAISTTPRFEVIGLSYLLSLDVSFGIWFFAVLAHLQTGAERMLGWSIGPVQPFSDPASPSVAHLALGALFFLVFACFWHGRGHLRQVLRKAAGVAPEIDDSDELFSYRTAVFGFCGGGTLAVTWLHTAGLNLVSALVFLLSALAIFVGLARIISQTGLAYGRATVAAPVFTVNALGSSLVGPAGLTVLGLNFAWAADIRTFVMASAATGLKVARETGLETRRLFWAIAAAILVTLAGSLWAILQLAYTYGGINLVGWQFIGLPAFAGDWIVRHVNNPEPVQLWHLIFTGLGAVLMALMTWLKNHYIGFPLHPIGMTLGLTHPIYHVWFSVFLAWLIKGVVLKYGGARSYALIRPFFLGMTLGAFASAGIWLIVDAFTGMSGNVFTLG